MASLPHPPHTPDFPEEIWRRILRFATESTILSRVDYLPFESMQETRPTSDAESTRLRTCVSLMRVSPSLRAIAAEFLYEDVRIADARDLESLLSGVSHGYGPYIRRLELPTGRYVSCQSQSLLSRKNPVPCAPNAPSLGDILALCPHLEILVRPRLHLDAEDVTFWTALVAKPTVGVLSHLKRLEWHESILDPNLYGSNDVERLREIIAQAPKLHYLFLSSDRPNPLAGLPLPPSLQTLRLNRSQFHSTSTKKSFIRRRPLVLPNLTNLILHTTAPSPLLDFLGTTGRLLRVLEFAFAPQMTFSPTEMHRIFNQCHNVEEVVYYLGAPEISPLTAIQAPSVKRVRLRIHPGEWSSPRPVLRAQMDILEGPSFPNLDELVLQDPTGLFLRREWGKEFLSRMAGRGCRVRYED
ncbi:hypothetical protein C8R46DRAFT_1326754 [Mycena filopes]|nr:hypothetical protein C8R46DRAFT_1326754 [Mycena filopes]